METRPSITFIDRATGQIKNEPVYAGRFLFWSYNSRAGLAITNLILRHPLISAIYGWYHRQSLSRRKIESFISQMGINRKEFEKPVESYQSFSDFFIREIDLCKRPINHEPGSCISPVDGKVLASPWISAGQKLQIKRHQLNLNSFLRDDELARQFDGGSVLICRLSLADYHHVHFPDSGVPGKARRINGSLCAGGPYSLRHIVPFYDENLRVMTSLQSDQFGRMLIIEVGAFTVGSIQQRFEPGISVAKGDHRGYFELGGSTVVLLFQPGRIQFDDDILNNSHRQIETSVRMGERIGIALRSLK